MLSFFGYAFLKIIRHTPANGFPDITRVEFYSVFAIFCFVLQDIFQIINLHPPLLLPCRCIWQDMAFSRSWQTR
jgi:hypothetical protein